MIFILGIGDWEVDLVTFKRKNKNYKKNFK